jgi:hypothetical protein
MNAGVDWDAPDNQYWSARVTRTETLSIVLEGNSEFEASDVTISGDQNFTVPDGYRMLVTASKTGEWAHTIGSYR